MTTKLNFVVEINKPVETVFAFATDPSNASKWQGGIVRSKVITPGPMGPGTQDKDVREFLGQRLESVVEIAEYVPNQR